MVDTALSSRLFCRIKRAVGITARCLLHVMGVEENSGQGGKGSRLCTQDTGSQCSDDRTMFRQQLYFLLFKTAFRTGENRQRTAVFGDD